MSFPEPEIGTRLVKQLVKLGKGIAAIQGLVQVDEGVFMLLRRVGRDTLPSKRYQSVKTLHRLFDRGPLPLEDVAKAMGVPSQTVRRELEDLDILNVVGRSKEDKKPLYRMTQAIKEDLDMIDFFCE